MRIYPVSHGYARNFGDGVVTVHIQWCVYYDEACHMKSFYSERRAREFAAWLRERRERHDDAVVLRELVLSD